MSKNYKLRNYNISSLPEINHFLEVIKLKDDFYQFVKNELNIKEQLVNSKSLQKMLYDKYNIDIENRLDITYLYFHDKQIIENQVFKYVSLKDWVNESIPLEHMVSKDEMKKQFDKRWGIDLYPWVEWDELEKLNHEEYYNKLNDIINDDDFLWNGDCMTSTMLQYDQELFKGHKPLNHDDLENIKDICKNVLKEHDHTVFLLTEDLKILDKIEDEVVLDLFTKFVSKNQERIDWIVENYSYSFLKEMFVKSKRTRSL